MTLRCGANCLEGKEATGGLHRSNIQWYKMGGSESSRSTERNKVERVKTGVLDLWWAHSYFLRFCASVKY